MVIDDKPISGIVVMHKEPLSGNVYEFGGHGGAFWKHTGTVEGFA